MEINMALDNAAFEDNRNEEIARILEDIARRIRKGEDAGRIWDINGNSIGDYIV